MRRGKAPSSLMTRHLSDNEIEQYRRRTIAADDLIVASRHLSECDDCYRRFNPNPDIRRAYAAFRNAIFLDEASLSDHLTYEELSGHVDGILNGKEADRCWGHIELCAECREDVEELREFKAGAHASEDSPLRQIVRPARPGVPRPVLVRFGWSPRPLGLAHWRRLCS